MIWYILLIYLIGYVVAYYVLKITGHTDGNKRTWEEVLSDLFKALFSWIAVAIFIIQAIIIGALYLYDDIIEYLNKSHKDPPKYL